jgi:transcriptional regulator with XRE-family HTH domain
MAKRIYPNLKAYLKATGMTQMELAAKLGRSQAYVSKLVRRIQQPSLDEALAIADKIGVPVESLVAQTPAESFQSDNRRV